MRAAKARGASDEEAEEEGLGVMQARMQAMDLELQASHSVTQMELMEAQTAFADDAAVQRLMREVKCLIFGEEQTAAYEAMSAAAPAHMTASDFVPLFKKHLGFMEAKIAAFFAKAARDTAGASAEEKEAYMQFLLSRDIEALQAGALAASGLAEDAFKGCMIKFGQDARIVMAMNASHERQEAMRQKFVG